VIGVEAAARAALTSAENPPTPGSGHVYDGSAGQNYQKKEMVRPVA
jgi:hypothetical protein